MLWGTVLCCWCHALYCVQDTAGVTLFCCNFEDLPPEVITVILILSRCEELPKAISKESLKA